MKLAAETVQVNSEGEEVNSSSESTDLKTPTLDYVHGKGFPKSNCLFCSNGIPTQHYCHVEVEKSAAKFTVDNGSKTICGMSYCHECMEKAGYAGERTSICPSCYAKEMEEQAKTKVPTEAELKKCLCQN